MEDLPSKVIRTDKESDGEDSRFFASGIDPEYAELLDYVDKAESEPEVADFSELKKRLITLQKLISENSRLRTKYPEDPLKFADSEVLLNEGIKKLIQILDKDPYLELQELNFISTLSSLLTHENTDICLSAVDLLDELLDEDSFNTEDYKKHLEANKFLELLLDNGCFELLIQNLYRLDEYNKPDDREGVYKTMNIIENSLSIRSDISEPLIEKTKLMDWLVYRTKEKSFDTNILYAVELLSILLLNRRSIRLKFCSLNGVDNLLQIIGKYRKRDPQTINEVEFLQNTYNALISSLREPEVKEEFLKLEGVELMIIALSNMKMSRISSVKVLDTAFDGPIGLEVCENLCEEFITLKGLKYLFPALLTEYMKKYSKKYKAEFDYIKDKGVIHSLFRHINSPTDLERIIRKFYENDYQKMKLILSLYSNKLNEYEQSKLRFSSYASSEDEEYNFDIDIQLRDKMENDYTLLTKLSIIVSYVYVNCEMVEGMKDGLVKLFNENSVQISKLRHSINECIKSVSIGDDNYSENEEDSIREKIMTLEVSKLSKVIKLLPSQD